MIVYMSNISTIVSLVKKSLPPTPHSLTYFADLSHYRKLPPWLLNLTTLQLGHWKTLVYTLWTD